MNEDSSETPNPLDRRGGARSSAEWIGKRFDEGRLEMKELAKAIGDTRMDIVVGFQQVDGKIDDLKSDIEHLRSIAQSAYHGDATEHAEAHKRIEAREKVRSEEVVEAKELRQKLKYGGILASISVVVFLIALGALEWAKNFILGVNQGKSAMELQKGEPAKDEKKDRFNR